MKNVSLIIKIAVIVSAIASLFSIVTLIRAIIIKANIVLPIIQVVGSLAIFAVCFIMFRLLSGAPEEDEGEDDGEDESFDETRSAPAEKTSDKKSKSSRSRKSRRKKESEETDTAQEEETPSDQAEKEADELYEKYHLSEFENKKVEE